MVDVEDSDNSDPDQLVTIHGRLGNVTFKPYRDIKTRSVVVSVGGDGCQGSTDTTVDHIYPEILCHIFSYLDTSSKGRAAQVCTRWRNILNTKEIWRGCEARLHLRRLSSSVIPSLIQRGIKRVQVLSVRKSLKDLVSGLRSLTSLNLSGCSGISDQSLQAMFTSQPSVPGLTSLDLSLCKEVTDRSIEVITSQAGNIEILRLGGCTGISNLSLKLVARRLRRLRSLDLRSCWQVADSGIHYLCSPPAALELDLLNLQDCQKVSDLALRHISSGLRVDSLNLSFCANISDSGMKSLSKMSSLRSLNLRSCDNMTDIGVGYLAEGSVGLQGLDLSFCDRVTDRSMVHIASGLFNLRSLSLVACKVTDEGIAKICKTLADLHVLNIGQCSSLTDVSLGHIGARLRNLEAMDLYGCNEISLEALETLRLSCPSLKDINFNLWH